MIPIIVAGILMIGCISWLVARKYHVSKLHKRLGMPLVSSERGIESKSKIPPELLPIAGISAYDAAYSLSNLDPRVLAAMNFSTKGGLPSFHDQLLHAELKYSGWFESAQTIEGRLNRLEGYVAEKYVAFHLSKQGHIIDFPPTPNQPGYDLWVDGSPVQVKNTLYPSEVHEHLQNYPDIPVFVNSELADQFLSNPDVTVDFELSHQEIAERTSETIEDITSIGYSPWIPYVTLALSSFKEGSLLMKGATDPVTVAEHITVDTTTRWAGAWAGAELGALIGSFAGGPIGAGVGGVLGALSGVTMGRSIGNGIKERHLRRAQEEYKTALIEAGYALPVALKAKHHALLKKHKKIQYNVQKSNFLKRIFWPSANDLIYYELNRRYKALINGTQRLSEKIVHLLEKDESNKLKTGQLAVEYGITEIFHPTLKKAIYRVVVAYRRLQEEMAKLGRKK